MSTYCNKYGAWRYAVLLFNGLYLQLALLNILPNLGKKLLVHYQKGNMSRRPRRDCTYLLPTGFQLYPSNNLPFLNMTSYTKNGGKKLLWGPGCMRFLLPLSCFKNIYNTFFMFKLWETQNVVAQKLNLFYNILQHSIL